MFSRVLLTCVLTASFASLAHAQGTSRVKLRTKNLEVELPAGWKLGKHADWTIGNDVIVPVDDDATAPTIDLTALGGDCDKILEKWSDGKPLEPRLAMIPEAYHSKVAYPGKGPGVHYVYACLATSDYDAVHVRLRFMPDESTAGITAALAAIAHAYEMSPSERARRAAIAKRGGTVRRLEGTGLVILLPPRFAAMRFPGKPIDMITNGSEAVTITYMVKVSSCDGMITSLGRRLQVTPQTPPSFAPTNIHASVLLEHRGDNKDEFTFCQPASSRGAYMYAVKLPTGATPSREFVALLQSLAGAITPRSSGSATAGGTDAPRAAGTTQRLPGTGLQVAILPGWRTRLAGSGTRKVDIIERSGEGIAVRKFKNNLVCAGKLQQWQTSQGVGTQQPLPAFAPSSFHPSIVVAVGDSSDVYVFCRRKGLDLYLIVIDVPPGTHGSTELVDTLHAIATAITPPQVATSTSRTRTGSSTAGTTARYDTSWRPQRDKASANTFVLEARAGMLAPATTVSSSYAIAGGLSRLNLGKGSGFTLATELTALAGYAGNAGLTLDGRAGIGGAFAMGTSSRFGVLVGAGADGIGVGEEEDDPTKLVLPLGGSFYAAAVLRTELSSDINLQLVGTYRDRAPETVLAGEARVQMLGGRRPWSVVAYYTHLDIANLIGGGIAFGL